MGGCKLFRNPETLEFIAFAPIYDSGTALCYNRNERQFNHYESKPFYADCNRQAALITSFDWFDKEKAICILEDIEDVFAESIANGFMTAERVRQLKQFAKTKYEYLCNLKG